MPFDTFLKLNGVKVIIERNGNEIQSIDGLFNTEKSTNRRYCGFLPNTDIKPNDWIIKAETTERFYIEDTATQNFQGKTTEIKAYYQTETEYRNRTQNSATSVFNIQNAYGSVIGSNNIATINYDSSIEELKRNINESDSSDKDELNKIVSLLEMVVNNQVPASKGLFSKFADVMERNSWITGSIAGSLLSWLMSQIP